MNKLIAVGAVLIALTLTGCGSPSEKITYPSPDTSYDAPEPMSDAEANDLAFRVLMGQKFGEEAVEGAVQVAESFCTLLDSTDYESAVLIMLNLAEKEGVTAEQLGQIIGGGVVAYCPEYTADMEAFNDSL